jgi:hypothetical protein
VIANVMVDQVRASKNHAQAARNPNLRAPENDFYSVANCPKTLPVRAWTKFAMMPASRSVHWIFAKEKYFSQYTVRYLPTLKRMAPTKPPDIDIIIRSLTGKICVRREIGEVCHRKKSELGLSRDYRSTAIATAFPPPRHNAAIPR